MQCFRASDRVNSFTAALAEKMNTLGTGRRWKFSHFRKTSGYAAMPLDGVWLRAPYPHNDSVPTLRDLLKLPEECPAVFWRGYDVARRRIFRDSFWKGSFAADNLLGWEERVRTAALGGRAERLGALFAGGSFWKRFDRIESGLARGHVVNYEMQWLPGDPEVREIEYPNDSRRYFRKGDRILLLNYRNDPYRIVYDTIKVIDEQNAIGVMHRGVFPDGFEFATFVMARHNYPFEKMALEDHHLLFASAEARRPVAADLAGDWTGWLVFLGRPNASLLNQANPAVLRVSFWEEGGAMVARLLSRER